VASNKDTHAERLELVEACEEHLDAFLAYATEAQSLSKDRLERAIRDPQAHLRQVRDWSRGVGLTEGRVPVTECWLIRDGRDVVAVSGLRHRLTPHLEHEGGHIGYGVRPSQRRKGYGTAVCRLTLQKARAMGMTRVLITCDTDNVASARIIETNGGALENRVIARETGKMKNRYWINL